MTWCQLDPIQRFSLGPGRTEGTSTLLDDGASTQTSLDGDQLEAQFATSHAQHLVIVSTGSPYEAGLYLYLLDSAHVPVDAIELSAPYVGGLFVGVESSDNTQAQFEFDGGVRYTVRVATAQRWWLPLPQGARRHGAWQARRFLELRRINDGTQR